jgi:hypothetical protein
MSPPANECGGKVWRIDEAFPDLLARHQFAGGFDQSLEYLERLLLKPKTPPLLA